MRFGFSVPDVGDPAALVAFAVEADAAGWDGVFVWDHLHFRRGARLEVHDPWVLLGAMAVRTERVRLGTMVTPLPRRRPWKLAKEVVTLDHLSGGRAVLGLGLGAPPEDDFAAFGDEPDLRVRAALLDEGLEILDAVLRGKPIVHEGDHFAVDADLQPGALQRPRLPIWLAARAPAARPRTRAMRWDGIAPIAADGNPLTPDALADYLDGADLPSNGAFDVVVTRDEDGTAEEYEDAGATWLLESRWPTGDWLEDLRAYSRQGPPT